MILRENPVKSSSTKRLKTSKHPKYIGKDAQVILTSSVTTSKNLIFVSILSKM